jgi:hypothetical protein
VNSDQCGIRTDDRPDCVGQRNQQQLRVR